MIKRSFILFLIFFNVQLFAQKQPFGKSTSFYRTVEYFEPGDSSKNYAIVYHPNQSPKKMLILLTGFGESPFLAERESDIPTIAASNGILTLILSNNDGITSFHIDGNAQYYLDSLIPVLLGRYNIPEDAYYVGGFSLGGSGMVKYVQHCNVYNITPKPKAVFAIDPPLDFLRLYKVYDRWYKEESPFFANKPLYKIMLDKMETFFRGTPADAYENYLSLSPFCYEDTKNFGVILFENTPITIYCEPDFDWGLKEKKWNAYDWNILDNVTFINGLIENGNTNAQLIITQNKGERKILKLKYPHSWSIADGQELIKWLMKF